MIPELARRFSARDFTGATITPETLRSLLEAAQSSPSSYNDQPWTFIVALRQDEGRFAQLLLCMGGNAVWAKEASALLACVAKKDLDRERRPNPHAWHDIGLAVMAMAVQGVSLGLQMREMAGIDRSMTRQLYQVRETHDIVTGLAVGVARQERDPEALRDRKPLDQFVFQDAWGKPADLG